MSALGTRGDDGAHLHGLLHSARLFPAKGMIQGYYMTLHIVSMDNTVPFGSLLRSGVLHRAVLQIHHPCSRPYVRV